MGSSQVRREDNRFLTGQGNFVGDVVLPGMVHAAFLRSPYGHARLLGVEASAARKLPGVLAVVTAGDLEGKVAPIPTSWLIEDADLRVPPHPPLARHVVRYAGEAVAVVVAEDPSVAEDALELIHADYEPLPVVVDQEAALKDGAPRLHEEAPNNQAFRWVLEGGNVERAFREADVVVPQRLVNQRVQPAALETRAAVAQWRPKEGRMTLWVTSQNPHDHRHILASVLGIPERRFRVISPDVGGGFGSKGPIYPGEAVVCHLSRLLGRPVRWVEGRAENFQATTHGRGQVQYAEVAARRDGTILGLKVKAFADMGAYLSTAAPGIPTVAFASMLSGCYRIGAVRAEVVGAFTNATPVDAYRGAGRPEASYLVERMVDILARRLGLDPVIIRRRNFIPSTAFPYKAPTDLTYDSGDYQATLDKALELIGYRSFRDEQAQARGQGLLLGIGLSSYVEMCGVGPGLRGTSTVRLHANGKLAIYSGGHPHGQGGETALAQIAGDALGLPLEDIEVIHGDTEAVPRGVGTFGSRTMAVEGSSVAISTQELLGKARRVAAHLMEAREEDLVFEDGRFHVKGVPGEGPSIQEVAFAAYTTEDLPTGMEPGLEASNSFNPEDFVFPFGTHICTVEVDRDTGEVHILRYVAVDDCGRVVNPLLVEGQVHGGVLQGIGQALWEEARYDEGGNLLTSTFMEYLIPTALEAPRLETHRTETPTPRNPLGAKGVGEAGTIAAPQAVVNAIVDALEPYGVVHLDMPVTPEKVWRAIHRRSP